jgi:hypothetical protein
MRHAFCATRFIAWTVCALGATLSAAAPTCAFAQTPPSAETRLKELNLTSPPVTTPVANYMDSVRVGNLLFLAGNTAPPDLQGEGR